ncbi:hypothetical protein P3T76_014652 [Phytophthora citrophthora]|uniref:PX domain-containing protein n=1 Tax=Phytophthora citrophthora TaxID=4793 RepID=A0AAD9G0K8_9STRA|nr:hypothetical protein P3T76_014652 [Phytophthora citrophthora]
MGCKHSKDATLDHRGSSIAVPLHPTTPSYHAQDSKLWMTTSGSQSNEFREELPSFVISDSADLVGSSDGEPVQGLVSGFTFSFIHTSEVSSSSGLSLTSSFVSEEQISPGPPESLTFAMTGDPIELQPIPEERRGHDVTPSESGVTEPEGEASPPAAVNQVGESSAVTASTVTESELLVELDASGFSHQSENSSYNTGDTRRSIPASEHSEAGEYMVTETGDVVRQVEPVPESDVITNDPVERESIDEVAAEIAQNVIDAAVSNVAKSPNRDRSALVAQSSLQVEPSSTGIFYLSAKTQPSENAPVQSARPPIYAIVGTSSDKGVVLYHVQLMDDVTDSAKWPAPLRRRYSRFSKMYRKLKETKLPSADKLPKLPRAGVVHYVRGRQSKRTIEERQQQFSNLLRYIAEHRELCDNAAFQSFLTQ